MKEHHDLGMGVVGEHNVLVLAYEGASTNPLDIDINRLLELPGASVE